MRRLQWLNLLTFTFTLIIILSTSLMTSCDSRKPTHINNKTDQISGRLNITGSSTIAPLAAELAKIMESKHPDLRINVQTGGSSRGLADARQGTADIGMVSRALKPSENDLQSHLLAKDGVTMIVYKDNPIKELTIEQIKDIYLGKIKNWKSLNGIDKKITVINKAEGRSTLEVFLAFFHLNNSDIKPDIVIGDNEQAVKLVSRNPGAIGYVSIGTAEYNVKAGTTIKTLPLNGVPATTEKLASGEFPLSRELNFVTKGEPSALAQTFINFTKTDEAKKVIKEFGFVPIK